MMPLDVSEMCLTRAIVLTRGKDESTGSTCRLEIVAISVVLANGDIPFVFLRCDCDILTSASDQVLQNHLLFSLIASY